MSKGRSNRLVGQIGEFLVCAQLGKPPLNLIATPFAGNVPEFDVIATDQFCRTVPIQVKTSTSDNWPSNAHTWMHIAVSSDGRQVDTESLQPPPRPRKVDNPELIYVLVALGKPGAPDRYFVLTKGELQKACIDGYRTWMEKQATPWKRPRKTDSADCRYFIRQLPAASEDNWQLISDRLASLPKP